MARGAGGKAAGIDRAEPVLGLVEAADHEQMPDLERARMRGIGPVAVGLERRDGGIQRLGGPAELARSQCDLGLGDDAAGAGHGLLRAKAARGAPQQRLGATEIAELRHGDAAQRQRRRVLAQRNRFSAPSGSPAASAAPRP